MNINNISRANFQNNFIEINLKHSSMKSIGAQSHSSMENVSAKSNNGDNLEISSTAVSKYEFSNRLKEAFKNGKEDGKFIENVANEYMKIKQEIKGENCSEITKENINMLDETLKDVIDYGVEEISNKFDAFFNYSSNMLSVYGMKTDEETFDKEEFKKNLDSLMNSVVDTIKSSPDNIKKEDLNEKINSILSSKENNGSLEKMGFEDIKKVDSILSKLPRLSFSDSIDGIKDIIKNYRKGADKLIDSSDLSDNIKENLKKSVRKNVRAYGKVSTYKHVMNNYKDELEKLMSLYASLSSQYDSLEKDIKKCMKENNLKMIKSLLKMQMNLQKEMNNLKIRIDKEGKEKDSLENNPDSIEGTEEFKKVSEAFNEE
ncbi:hypothetical protein [Clostridium lundense]|uniref:hypothetical protein n=1 Tax=Clostridium lundense TaxID=319475 RepID=UPI000480A18B|nr:hypothetical protein [Clostridium lundense]